MKSKTLTNTQLLSHSSCPAFGFSLVCIHRNTKAIFLLFLLFHLFITICIHLSNSICCLLSILSVFVCLCCYYNLCTNITYIRQRYLHIHAYMHLYTHTKLSRYIEFREFIMCGDTLLKVRNDGMERVEILQFISYERRYKLGTIHLKSGNLFSNICLKTKFESITIIMNM